MKKLYNKALMYQYFYIGKWILLIGSGILALSAYYFTNSNISLIRQQIAQFQDSISEVDFQSLVLLISILFVANIAKTGFNKRSVQAFILSGPYSKEEIKINEILYLIIMLFTLTGVYIYINLCIIYREQEIIKLSSLYMIAFVYNIVRMLLVGMAFIVYITVIDMLFSSSIVTVAIAVSFPVTTIAVAGTIFNYLNINATNYMLNRIYRYLMYIFNFVVENQIFYERVIFSKSAIITFLIFILVGIICIWLLNKKITYNLTNRVFAFKAVEKATLLIYSISFSIIIVLNYMNVRFYRKAISDSIVIAIVATIIVSIVIYKLFKRMLQKIIV